MVEEIHRPKGDTNTAKQSEILIADIEHVGRWIETVWALFDRQLAYTEFVAAYMDALKAWEAGRKLTQSKLHWKYGPSRRRKGLIERDTRKQLMLMGPRLEASLRKLLTEHPEFDNRFPRLAELQKSLAGSVDAEVANISSAASPPAPAPKPRSVWRRDMSEVDRGVAQLIHDEVEVDVSTSTDDQIIDAYLKHGYDRATALAWLDELLGEAEGGAR